MTVYGPATTGDESEPAADGSPNTPEIRSPGDGAVTVTTDDLSESLRAMRLSRPGWTYEDTAEDLMNVLQGAESCAPVSDAELSHPPLTELFLRCKRIEQADGSWNGGDVVDIVTDMLTTAGFLHHPAAQPDPVPHLGVTITRDQLEAWAGRPLTDDEIGVLGECVPNSSIPQAIATIVEQFEPEDFD